MKSFIKKKDLFVFFFVLFTFFVFSRQAVYSAQETSPEPKFLDPEIVDKWFNETVGKKFESVVGDAKIGIPYIPYHDDFYDNFGKISPFDFTLGFTLANIYLWRGQNLGSDTSWMPYVTVSPDFEPVGDLSFTYWADITQHVPGKDDLEYDFVVDYSLSVLDTLKKIGCSVDDMPYIGKKLLDFTFQTGYLYYWFPPVTDDSHEIYFGQSYNWPFHPYWKVYNDFDLGRGVWWETGISQDFDLKLFTVSTFASLGYNHRQWSESSALQTLFFGGSVPVPIGKHMTIEPFLSYSKRLKRTFTEDGTDLTHDEIYGGFNYTLSF